MLLPRGDPQKPLLLLLFASRPCINNPVAQDQGRPCPEADTVALGRSLMLAGGDSYLLFAFPAYPKAGRSFNLIGERPGPDVHYGPY